MQMLTTEKYIASGPQGGGRVISPKVSLRPVSKDLNIMYMYYYYIVLF